MGVYMTIRSPLTPIGYCMTTHIYVFMHSGDHFATVLLVADLR
jgi:hypothetical protein